MKVAACFARSGVDCVDVVRRMAEAQCLCPEHGYRVFPVAGGAMASVEMSDRLSSIRLFREGPQGNLLLVSGVPIDLGGSLDARLERIVGSGLEEGVRGLQALDGAFAALFWDAKGRRLAVVTDPLGVQPLYVAEAKGALVIATELKAFPASGLVDTVVDPAGWGAFVSLGFTVGESTQLASVRRAAPACTMTYDAPSGRQERTTYWEWPAERSEITLENVETGPLLAAAKQEVSAYGQHTDGGTVLLSGGFDSRFLLALLCDLGLRPEAMAVAHKDELWNTDGRLAAWVARRLGVSHSVVTPARAFYGSPEYLAWLVMNEVTNPSLYLFIAQVVSLLRPEMGAVWEGAAPGICLHPYPVPPDGLKGYLRENARPRESMEWQAALRLFGRKRGEAMFDACTAAVAAEARRYPGNEYGVLRFKAANYMRNRLALVPLKVYANRVLPFTPGFGRAFWGLVAEIPHAVKTSGRLYFKIFERHFARAGSVPFLSGDDLFCDGSRGLDGWRASVPYRLAKSQALRFVRRAWRKVLGGSGMYWVESPLPDLVVRGIDAGHPDLDADGVRALQQQTPPYDWQTIVARQLLFHWQVWRWVMEGRLTAGNAAGFVADVAARGRA